VSESAPIIIAGGGIGGLALALALAQGGRRSIVLEQRQAFGGEGAGIQLGPNGTRVLQQLGLDGALRPLAGIPDALAIHHGRSGRTLAVLPFGRWIVARHGAPYWAVHRADLHAGLVAAVSSQPLVTLRPGRAFAAVEQKGDVVLAHTAEGEVLAGAALIGADGLWSAVRRIVEPDAAPRFAGATASRTVIPVAAAGRLALPAVGLWLSAGVNVVHYPVRGGAEIAIVVIAREDWQSKEWNGVVEKAALVEALCGLHPSLVEPLAAATDWRKWSLFHLPALPTWSAGRIGLIGDAAHPMMPHLAQGGVMALEDAVVLADALIHHPREEERALKSFEAGRRRRARRVQVMSRFNGRLYHLAPPFSWVRDTFVRTIPGAWMMVGYDWLYGWHFNPRSDGV
jgi:salicylate hydroxylase